MTIAELAAKLQTKIDSEISTFCELYDKTKSLTKEIEDLEAKMTNIVMELEPVESLVLVQNPQLEKIFETLKKIYVK